MATGQAAGVAAAISVREKIQPRKLTPAKIQTALKKQGVYLGTD
ncbi:MAG TPA: FAD-dependent oxidoreductase [bacterium]|nr:FAD-dependent oxidoreductase [bacterium]